MYSVDVRRRFEKTAFVYDGLIRRLVPWYNEQNEIIVDLVPFDKSEQVKVLDLGVGTGALSYSILKSFSKAQIVAFDLSCNMIKECRLNLAAFKDRITLRRGNFGHDSFGCGYDIVVSGLAIHHLKDDEKRKLFARIYGALNLGGVFLIREIVLGETIHLTELYRKMWCEYIKSNNENDEMWLDKHLKEDMPATVEDQMSWLGKAGFSDVGCHWRYLNFAIFGGRKLNYCQSLNAK
ncbi:MAG: class I SAM-dependent methyltransferase [Candidatus Anammoxibacter sp.]